LDAAMVDATDSAYSLLIQSIQDRHDINSDVLEVTDENGVVHEKVWLKSLVMELLDTSPVT
jgi:ribosomal protein L12E/L44/L45/RPP1/RPP2